MRENVEPKIKQSRAPAPRGTRIKKRASAPVVSEILQKRPLTTSSASVVMDKDYSKIPIGLRLQAARNKFDFYQRSDEQIKQFAKLRWSHM